MSFRLRRKSRPQADVEIYGGPLHQKQFDGGMNIDVPASEIKSNELAYAANVICREFGIESRPGSVQASAFSFSDLNSKTVYEYCSNPIKFGGYDVNYRNAIFVDSEIRYYGENPKDETYVIPGQYDYDSITSGAFNPGTGDTKAIPYRRGFLVFNASKISYSEFGGAFQVNAPNPVHGVKDDNASGAFKYRYLITLSRIVSYASDGEISSGTGVSAIANRLVPGSELCHESGPNGKFYNNSGTSTKRLTDYGEIFAAAAIRVGSGYTITQADLKAACSTAALVTDDLAARHFTHASIWRCRDYGDAGVALGNKKEIFYWVDDVLRADIFGVYAGYSDTKTDDVIQNQGIILKTQGFSPMPSGSCAEVAGGWMFVSDRTNVNSDNYLHYCAIANSPENFGYYFKDVQKWRFNQGISALRANQDILSIFCQSSSHICNMTSYVSDLSTLQSVPFLNYFHVVDRSIGIKDWATLDSIDENTMIAVCSDGSVRKWDTNKWGEDLSYMKCADEIAKIVSASSNTYERGSVGKYYNGAYYLWYSTNLSDTATTKCLRYGFGKKAGYGWTYYTGWAFPPFKRGVKVVDESNGVQRMIVFSASTHKFYWVETFNPFTGALDDTSFHTFQMRRFETDLGNYENSNSDGIEIASSWKFRELLGAQESDLLIHDESFNRWRPRDENVGYRASLAISMSAWKDGSPTATETIADQPRTASVKFTKEIAARRVQLGINTNKSAWRYVGIESHFRSIDRVNYATSGDASSSESTTAYPQWQAELASGMSVWLTRREKGLNRVNAIQMTANGTPSFAVGADGNAESAYLFSASANAHDYTDLWNAIDAYWTYDGDEDFATFPGYLASSASGTTPVFLGGPLFSLPRVLTVVNPLRIQQYLRIKSANSVNTTFCIFGIAVDAGFVGDYIFINIFYNNATGTYWLEVFGQQSGNPAYDLAVDTGIARMADHEFLIDIEVNTEGYRISIPEYGIIQSDGGFLFPQIAYIDAGIQRTNASNQGMLRETRIYTEAAETTDEFYTDETTSNTYYGDHTISFWVKSPVYGNNVFKVEGSDPMFAQFIDAITLSFSGIGLVTVDSVASGWQHFAIVRESGVSYVYQNNVLKGSFVNVTNLGGGNTVVGYRNGTGYIEDFRIYYNKALSAEARAYYYNDVLNNNGNMTMPQV